MYELQRPPLLEEESDGYRMRTARGSVLLDPGELRFL